MYLNKKPVFPTLSVSAVVHFYSFSTVHFKDHTLQTKTRPDIIMHFIKPFRTHIVCTKMCVLFSTFCAHFFSVVEHVSGFVVCCVQTTLYKWKVPSYLWAMWHTMLVSVYAISVILRGTVTGHNYSPSCNVAV